MKKRNDLILIYVLLALSFLPIPLHSMEQPSDRSLRFAMKTLKESIKETNKRYSTYSIGTGTGGECRYFEIDYEINENLSKDQARKILLDARNICISKFQEKKSKDPFYSKYNFDRNNIGITLYIKDTIGKKRIDPEIGIARLAPNGIYCKTYENNKILRYKSTFEETIQEAEAKNEAYLSEQQAHQDSNL